MLLSQGCRHSSWGARSTEIYLSPFRRLEVQDQWSLLGLQTAVCPQCPHAAFSYVWLGPNLLFPQGHQTYKFRVHPNYLFKGLSSAYSHVMLEPGGLAWLRNLRAGVGGAASKTPQEVAVASGSPRAAHQGAPLPCTWASPRASSSAAAAPPGAPERMTAPRMEATSFHSFLNLRNDSPALPP